MSGRQVLCVRGLSKQYDAGAGTVVALTDISFDVRAGEFFSVLGASGSGKSTLLRGTRRSCVPTVRRWFAHGRTAMRHARRHATCSALVRAVRIERLARER
jgi:ABC-type glutathione transport system ATPase component